MTPDPNAEARDEADGSGVPAHTQEVHVALINMVEKLSLTGSII